MKILWIVNFIFPEAATTLGREGVLKSTGGWLLASANELIKREEYHLAVASVSPDVQKLQIIYGEKIKYYVIPCGKGNRKYNAAYEKYWTTIMNDYQPDIVNIHGTEFSQALPFLKIYPDTPSVVSIQGLSSQIARFHNYGLTLYDIISNITFRDLLVGTLFKDKRRFESQGRCEKAIFKSVKYVIGRTTWDKSYASFMNSSLTYFHCNESLRSSFYSGVWEYEKCQPHTIFLSQGGYPYKGLHQLIKALPYVISKYPDTKVRIAGLNILRSKEWKSKIKLSGYGKYIKKLIKKLNLEEQIKFIGFKDEIEVKKELLSCNLYLCPSAIENSPNSLCEAQILGVPSIASYVGGIPDFIPNPKFGLLFRYEDVSILSHQIIEFFKYSEHYDNTEMRNCALNRHNLKNNVNKLLTIYDQILRKEQ